MKITCPKCEAVTTYHLVRRVPALDPANGKASRWEEIRALFPDKTLTGRIRAGSRHLGISERTMWRDYRTFKHRLENDGRNSMAPLQVPEKIEQ